MSQMLKEGQKKLRDPLILSPSSNSKPFPSAEDEFLEDCNFSLDIEMQEDIQQSLDNLMNDELSPIPKKAKLTQRLSCFESEMNGASIKAFNQCSVDPMTTSYTCQSNILARNLQFYPVVYPSTQFIPLHNQYQSQRLIAAPFFINTCNAIGNPLYYQQQCYYPQPIIVNNNYNASSILVNPTDKLKRIDKPKKSNLKKKEKEDENIYLQTTSCSDKSEDLDIVLDFITKCPAHKEFVLNNKSEADRLLKSVTFKNAKELFNCLFKDLEALFLDSYGNYFCQELLKLLSIKDRLRVWNTIIKKDVPFFGNHQYAHHVLQMLIELSIEKEQLEIVKIIKPFFDQLIYDSKGSHIIQKIITCFTEKSKTDLIDFIYINLTKLITNPQGVCSVKKFIINISSERSTIRSDFFRLIISNLPNLVNEKSAHYALLCIFEEWNCNNYKEIIDYLVLNFIPCSIQKYSARLIEKCLLIENKVSLKLIFIVFS